MLLLNNTDLSRHFGGSARRVVLFRAIPSGNGSYNSEREIDKQENGTHQSDSGERDRGRGAIVPGDSIDPAEDDA